MAPIKSTLVDHPSSLPTLPLPPNTEPSEVASSFFDSVDNILSEENFVEDAIWRDVFALTGTLRTFYSASTISKVWKQLTKSAEAGSCVLDGKSAKVVQLPQGSSWVEARFLFEAKAAPARSCSIILSLVTCPDGKWRIWVMRTILEQLKDQPNVDVLEPAQESDVVNGKDKKTHFDCVVVGGGQAGLSTAGRLKALGLSYIVLDKNKKVGDNWKKRYDAAKLHTIREYAHLPFERTFTPEYQEYLTRDDLAQGYQEWAKKFDIVTNMLLGIKSLKGSWDGNQNTWTLQIEKVRGAHLTITSSFVVLAGGSGGQVPVMPTYENEERFKGTIMHSVEYTNARRWKGKHGMIVGTANTAHDLAEDMLASGLASVTMIQRSKTYIVPVEYFNSISKRSYNATVPTEDADRSGNTNPYVVTDLMSKAALGYMGSKQPERFESLENAGFKTDQDASLMDCLYNRGGGHYLDVGASEKISSGLIKVRSDALPVRYTSTGLMFSDGSCMDADLVAFATGFKGNMRYMAEEIFGPEIAAQIGDFWTLDKEGEIKNAWKLSGHPRAFYHGGTIGQARWYSRFIAMQIKASLLGTPLPIYIETPA